MSARNSPVDTIKWASARGGAGSNDRRVALCDLTACGYDGVARCGWHVARRGAANACREGSEGCVVCLTHLAALATNAAWEVPVAWRARWRMNGGGWTEEGRSARRAMVLSELRSAAVTRDVGLRSACYGEEDRSVAQSESAEGQGRVHVSVAC